MEIVKGKIIEINGPVIRACGFSLAGIGDQVEVGDKKLIGEIIRMQEDVAIIQVYEDTTGLKPEMEVISIGHPIAVELGPGLIGTTYDGLQRPLYRIAEKGGNFIKRGEKFPALDREKKWHVVPLLKQGMKIFGGEIIAEVDETQLIKHKILIPPLIKGELIKINQEGDYSVEDEIAVVKNENGEEILVKLYHTWPIRIARPTIEYLPTKEPLITGQRVLDFFFPLAKGGTAIIPGGFGTGKTVTQHQLAKWSNADVIIYIGCGERGNEMTQVLEEFPKLKDPKTKRPLIERTILIANTSNMPVTAREASIYTGITMAEYFRDMGYDVALMADSTSRWAEALREISGRLEEMPAEEGYPAYLATRLAEFYERGGRRRVTQDRIGSISIIGAVSPAGGDFSEPVTQHSKRFTKTFWALDKDLASARHFPSINWIQSYSGYLDSVRNWWDAQSEEIKWSDLREQAMALLQEDSRLQKVVKLIGPDALPDPQRLIIEIARIIKEGFLQQSAFDEIDSYCVSEKQLVLMDLIFYFYKKTKGLLSKRIPVSRIFSLPCILELMRAKSEIPNENLKKFEELKKDIDTELEKLSKEYE
jgi:V/A-type H+-transporting ATPase subunit A